MFFSVGFLLNTWMNEEIKLENRPGKKSPILICLFATGRDIISIFKSIFQLPSAQIFQKTLLIINIIFDTTLNITAVHFFLHYPLLGNLTSIFFSNVGIMS